MHTDSRPLPPTLLLAAAAVLALAASAAQHEEAASDYTYFDAVDVNLVNVEVVVTDKRGNPIRGLGRHDFELFEDGRPVEIANFYSIDAAPAEALEPVAAVAARRAVVPAEQQLHLAVFVDGMTLQPADRRRVLAAVRDFFDYDLARPTSLILATFDGNLSVESIPRFEPDLLNARLETLEKAAARGAQREMERRTLLKELEMASRNGGIAGGTALNENVVWSEAKGALDSIQLYADQLYGEVQRSIGAVEEVVEALAGLSGRKALLYISGGLERYPGEAMFSVWEGKFRGMEPYLNVNFNQRKRLLDTTPDVQRLIRHANSNRVTFYAIGTGRGPAAGGVSAEEGGYDIGAAAGPHGGRTWSTETEAIDESNLKSALSELAAATGGLSMTNSRNYDRLLGGMNRDFGSYYSLGYAPDRQRDGKRHKLAVRVAGGDFEVRYRETFREQTLEELMNGRTRSAALLGRELNPLQVSMEFGASSKEKNEYMVPVMVKVPLARLSLLERDENHEGRIGIFICARDAKGRVSPVQSIDVPIRVPTERLPSALGQVAGYRMTLRMRPEAHSVAVSVRDALAQVSSTVTGSWSPAAPAG